MRKQSAESPEPVRRLQHLTHTLARMPRTRKEITVRLCTTTIISPLPCFHPTANR